MTIDIVYFFYILLKTNIKTNKLKNIQENILKIRSDIIDAQKKYRENSKKITLVAISKHQSAEKIKEALKVGQIHFGESYLKEALEKIKTLSENEIIWHYIGRIQSKKTKQIALNFDWVESVSNFEAAELLNKHRPNQMNPLNICIQVNISKEASKSGILTDEILPVARKIYSELPSLKLRGLMTIPAYHENFEQQLKIFKKMAVELNKLQQDNLPVDTLSMGMSHDFEKAIAAGANMVRIGSAIFGKRIQ